MSKTTEKKAFQYEIMNNLLLSIPAEMAVIMKQTSYSPIFSEILDFSTAIMTPDGDLIAQYVGVPIHLAAMEFCLRAIINKFKDNFEAGDIIIHNDPYDGGSHLPDINIVMPVFHEGKLVAFSANRGHHADVGGANPGSFAGNCTSIFQEGVRIPAMKLYEAGELNKDIMDMICANVRVPVFTNGDIHAQIASCRLGERRIKELLVKFGAEEFKNAMNWAMDYSEKRTRAAIAEWPDGVYEASVYMDNDGVILDKHVKVHAKVTVKGDELIVDMSGSDKAVRGPINSALGSATAGMFISIQNFTDPTIPSNHGCYRPVTIIAPPGTIVNAQYPSALVSGNTETTLAIIMTVSAAIAQALPDKMMASDSGTTANLSIGGIDPATGYPYVAVLSLPSGCGSRKTKDGMFALSGRIGGLAQYMSVEMFEAHYPFITDRYKFVQDSGGPGRFKGGLTAEWVARINISGHSAEIVGCTEKSKIPPYGIFGGMPGLHGDWHIEYSDGGRADVTKSSAVMGSEDLLVVRTPGGGGYGDPLDREIEHLQYDLDQGYVSVESAERDYGAVVDGKTKQIDLEATRTKRAKLKKEWKRDQIFMDENTQPYAAEPFRVVTVDGKEHYF